MAGGAVVTTTTGGGAEGAGLTEGDEAHATREEATRTDAARNMAPPTLTEANPVRMRLFKWAEADL